MPEVELISYSREECIVTIRDYYSFLTKMYLREEDVLHPPEGGWPSITPEDMADLGKTDDVISLLRHLPYLRRGGNNFEDDPHGAAYCHFANWQLESLDLENGQTTGDVLRLTSESPDIYENVPPHVVCLTSGNSKNPVFLLDAELGIKEADWGGAAACWAVKDFVEMLKDQFIALSFIPIDSLTVNDVYASHSQPRRDLLKRVQDIYLHHGWSDLENFRKDECLEAIQTVRREDFPQL
ncbi:hypothetical protein LZ31DRAFT_563430 [Colletotrichum somersetense]|nr:hypothetical protein LZ31DRAFT_563430 [Colletotrichum somersetense]